VGVGVTEGVSVSVGVGVCVPVDVAVAVYVGVDVGGGGGGKYEMHNRGRKLTPENSELYKLYCIVTGPEPVRIKP